MALQVGTRVVITGLQSAAGAALNGSHGKILGYDEEKERWEVLVDDDPTQAKLLKACNLAVTTRDPSRATREVGPSDLQSEAPRRRRTSSVSSPHHRRAHSWGPSGRSASEPIALLQANIEIDRLRMTLQEWQSANQQWQAAYIQMQHQCVALEAETRHLRDVIEVAESGPNMNARFIARLARQNWKLGHEVGLRSHEVGSDDGLDSPTQIKPEDKEDACEAEDDSGRDRRPAGMRRLNLRKKDDASDTLIAQCDGEVSESSPASSSSNKRNGTEDRLPLDVDNVGKQDEVEACKTNDMCDKSGRSQNRGEEARAEERRLSQGSDSVPPRNATGAATSSGNAWAVMSSTVASVLGVTLLAVITYGRFMAVSEGSDFER
jgi:hypothetical protein